MKIILAAEVTRNEGVNLSGELVAEELVGLLEGENLQVEDSEYEVMSVEVLASAKEKKAALGDEALLIIDAMFRRCNEAHPIRLGREDEEVKPIEKGSVDEAVQQLMFADGIGPAIQAAKARRYKAEEDAKRKAHKAELAAMKERSEG